MWLVIILIAALAATVVHFGANPLRKHRFDFLALMLWGTFIMVLVDHSIAFMEEGGEFISQSTDGLVADSAVLGLFMAAPIVVAWVAMVFLDKNHLASRSASPT
jgi:hypothetical protein